MGTTRIATTGAITTAATATTKTTIYNSNIHQARKATEKQHGQQSTQWRV